MLMLINCSFMTKNLSAGFYIIPHNGMLADPFKYRSA